MTKLYQDSDLWDAYIQRRKIIGVLAAVTAVFLAVLVGLIIGYTQLPYKDPNGIWFIVSSCVWVAMYMFFAFPFVGIKLKRSNSYCKMLKFISVGLKEYAILPFEDIEDWLTRDGVDCNVAVFAIKNIKKDELLRRQIYVDGEKEFPFSEAGQSVALISQGNLLIEYEFVD